MEIVGTLCSGIQKRDSQAAIASILGEEIDLLKLFEQNESIHVVDQQTVLWWENGRKDDIRIKANGTIDELNVSSTISANT